MGKHRCFFTNIRALSLCLFILAFTLPSVTRPSPLYSQDTQIDPYYQQCYNRGLQYYQIKNYKEAAKNFELALFGIKDQTVIARGSVYLSLCHLYLNDLTESQRVFQKAEQFVRAQGLEALGLDDNLKTEFAELWNQIYPSEVIFSPKNEDGPNLYPPTADELERRTYRLERQIKAVPNDIIAYYDLFQVYLWRNDDKGAKKTLEKMMKENPEEIEGYYHIGMLEYRDHKFKAAANRLEKFLEKAAEIPVADEKLRGAWAYLILSYNFKGDKNKANQLAADVADALTQEVVISLDLVPRDSVVLSDILEKNKKAI